MKVFEFWRNAISMTLATLIISPLVVAMTPFIALAVVAAFVRALCDGVTFVCEKSLTIGVDCGNRLFTIFERIRGSED